jgi:hypothetical protein
MSANGGITKGKSHKEGGIPMVVKSTGQQVELEGGEGVINKRNMASDEKFEFQGKQMTTCEIASAINSAKGNGVQIDCDDVTGKKYAYEDGGLVFIDYKDEEIMYEPYFGKYYANDMEFDSLEEAQKFLDSGGVNEDLRGAYERGLFDKGGWVLVDGDTERKLGEYATESEAREMMYEYEGNSMLVQKSVWEKSNKYEGGGGVGNVYIALSKTNNGLLLSETFASQITNKQLFDYYKKRGYEIIDSNIFKVTNKDVLDVYKDAISKFIEEKYNELVDWENTFLSYEIVGDRIIAQSCFVQTQNGKEYKITPNDLVNKKFAEGGGVKDYNSLIGKYVNIYSMGVSTPTEHQIKDVQVSGENFRYRYVTLKFDLGIAPIPIEEADALMNNEIIFVNDNKEEFGVQLIPNEFKEGGDVRDFSWYQDFKKQELKRGTEHEMEHIDTIRKFKKKGVSDKEVAEAIAKDHLEEDENYYIELDKMESSIKLSEALNDFVKHKGYRKNSRKYNFGGAMSDSTEIVHLKFTEDFNGIIRRIDGKYIMESMFPKGKVYKFSFIANDGRTSSLQFGKTGAYMLVPNDIIDVVGFDENKYGNGGAIMPYQSMALTENDKVIMKLLTKDSTPSSFNSKERQKLATFRGSNVVNELSSSLIQKIYGLLFENHNIENPIKQLFLSNVGAGNIVSYAPKYIHKLMIDFDNKNPYAEVEKEINSILNEDKKYVLFNNLDIKKSDAIIHVYSNTNPEAEQLNNLLYQSQKSAIGLGVCEFTSRERLNKFQREIVQNQGSFAQNQMIMYKDINKYLMISEGITDEGQYTLIYTITKY